jgi:DNA-binding FadR family transcriptional regulator
MRKPVSKHALRRAMEAVQAEGHLRWEEPTGTVVDRLWHLIEKQALHAPRKRPLTRESVRGEEPVAV